VRGWWRSFTHAFDGILYAARTQRNLRIHLVLAALVLTAGALLRLDRLSLTAIALAIAVVIALELLNTAIEAIVDLLTVRDHPLAKTAKDAAAGAVLVAALAAAVVGYLTFYRVLFGGADRAVSALQEVPANLALLVLALTAVATIGVKAWTAKGSAFRGGAVSGHAALAFAAATFLTLLYRSPLGAALAYFVAVLVAQSRVESGFHTTVETIWGALLGAIVAAALYALVRPHLAGGMV